VPPQNQDMKRGKRDGWSPLVAQDP
jgi:hypothetical protein